MRITNFWIVHDPVSAHSELGDICFETDVSGLVLQARGGFDPDRPDSRYQHVTVYAGDLAREEAVDDAMQRLAAREMYDAALSEARRGD